MHLKNKPTFESELERRAQEHMRHLGFDFATHVKRLPGTPDIVLENQRVIVNVNGCFFHQHQNCAAARVRPHWEDYWVEKFKRIKARDHRNHIMQLDCGYRILTLWGCSLHFVPIDVLRSKITAFVNGTERQLDIGYLDQLAQFKPGSAA